MVMVHIAHAHAMLGEFFPPANRGAGRSDDGRKFIYRPPKQLEVPAGGSVDSALRGFAAF